MRSIVFLVFALAACGKTEAVQQAPSATASVKSAPVLSSSPPVASSVPAAPLQKIEIEIASVGETMAFDKTTLTVPSGAQVHLVFKNNAKSDVLLHNWVLVTTGTEAKVAADGLLSGADGGYLPGPFAHTGSDVLAATPLAIPGKTSEITFMAPAPGKYPYICTFPGHYMMMKGVLTET
jgi:azurin